MSDAYSAPVALAIAASVSGIALLVASAFVRRRWTRGAVWCFWLGQLLMHGGNTARHWMENLQEKAELQSTLASLTAAERTSPEGRFLTGWLAERMAEPPVDAMQWSALAFSILGFLVALVRPEWLMLPPGRIGLGLSPTLGPRLGAST